MLNFKIGLLTGRQLAFVMASVLIPASSGASAAEWTAQAELQQTVRYDDNIRLTRPGTGSEFGSITTPRLSLYKRTSDLDLGADAEFSLVRFAKDSNLNSEDANLVLGATGREKWGTWSLPVRLDRRNTRETEVTDSGLLGVDAEALTAETSPSISYNLSPINSLSLLGNWRETRYNTSVFDDFRSGRLGGRWTRQLSELDSVYISSTVARFENLDEDFTTHWLESLIGYDSDLTARLSWGVYGGARWVFDQAPQTSGGAVGFTGGARANYDVSETFTVSGNYDRSLQPSSSGQIRDTDSVTVALDYQLGATLRTTLAARYIRQNTLGAGGGGDRDYFEVQPGLVWTIAPEWSLNTAYRFRGQDRNDGVSSGFAKGHTVLFGVTYRPERWKL